jgi:Holliday junction resolvase RusA-like endonuclease
MGTIEFYFQNLKPFSTNNTVSFNKKGRYYKNTKKDDFQKRVFCEMISHKADIFEFETNFSVYEHFVAGSLCIFVPKSKLVTKKGYISQKSGDIDNGCKALLDSVFKHFEKLDDSIICNLQVFKMPSPDNNYNIGLQLQRMEMTTLEEFSSICQDIFK